MFLVRQSAKTLWNDREPSHIDFVGSFTIANWQANKLIRASLQKIRMETFSQAGECRFHFDRPEKGAVDGKDAPKKKLIETLAYIFVMKSKKVLFLSKWSFSESNLETHVHHGWLSLASSQSEQNLVAFRRAFFQYSG